MKTLLSALFAVIASAMLSTNLSAQENKAKTLWGNTSLQKPGFMASPSFGLTQIDGATVSLLHLRAGMVFGDKLTAGGFFNLSVNEFIPQSETEQGIYMDYKAWGAFLEYTIYSDNIFHATFPLLIGRGEVEMDSETYDPRLGESGFLVIEPGALLEINLHDHIRLNLGITYRVVGNMTYRNLDQSDISGLSVQVGIKAGLFGR